MEEVYVTAGDVNLISGDIEIKSNSISAVGVSSTPSVYITDLPKGLRISNSPKSTPKLKSELLFSHLETDEKGNSVVTIQVPIDDSTDEISYEGAGGRHSRIIRSNALPVWKRVTPSKPGFISNYIYPHSLVRNPRSRLIIDCPTNIPVPEFKAQLADTSDIVTTLDIAPATKRRVKELTTNGVSKLFAHPGKPMPSKKLYNLYQRHLTSKPQTHELNDDLGLQPIGYKPSIDYSQVKRISRKRKSDPVIPTDTTQEGKVNSSEEKNNVVEAMVPVSDKIVRVLIKPGMMGEDAQEILILQDGDDEKDDESGLQHSIEVLLAAANRGEMNKSSQNIDQVYICDERSFETQETDSFMTEQIIVIENALDDEICETLETS